MKIDILFISYNRKSEVEYNLSHMSRYSNINKIICVDNGSVDGTDEIFKSISNNKIEFIKLNKNIGIEAYNIGAKISNADILIILDDDSHIDSDVVCRVRELFNLDCMLGILSFSIILYNFEREITKNWKIGPTPTFWGCGAAIRKSVWDKLGGYDPSLFLYTNEYDFAIRVWELGYKVKYDSSLRAFHRVSSMNRTSDRLVYYSIINNYHFIKKYFDKKYQHKLIIYDRIAWFIRSVVSGCVGSYFKALKHLSENNRVTPYRISEKIQIYYIMNLKIFESPLKKIIRKIFDLSIFNFSKNV